MTRFGLFLELVQRKHSNASAIYRHVSRVAFVKVNCNIDGRDAHVISVCTNSSSDSHVHIFGMFHSGWQFGVIKVEWTKTEDVSAGDWICPDSKDVAYH